MDNGAAARAVLETLEAAGHPAYFVGGCVRDALLGRPVHDYDVATSARPEEVTALFPRTVPTGIRHGTVTVIQDGVPCEVTTFRTEAAYSDGRRPDAVSFVDDLASDLARRDFTVNAMAMDLPGRIVDPFGGRADLAAGVLRAVGDPVRRFTEDALRMLRAVRFSAQLEFSVEPATAAAMARCAPLCARLSAERVREELDRTLLTAHPAAVLDAAEAGMLRAYGAEPGSAGAYLPACLPERCARWAALALALPSLRLESLRLDRHTLRQAREAAAAWEPPSGAESLARLVACRGWYTAACVCRMNGSDEPLEALRASGRCVTVGQLAVNGRDLGRGPETGTLLRRLLGHVLDHPEDNTRPRLLALAAEWRSESCENG